MTATPLIHDQAPQKRFEALDALRGIAACSVVIFHMNDFGLIAGLPFFRHSELMVDFFFVLSGFVIFAAYGDRLSQGFSKTDFLLLRLFRVYPLHLFMVAIYVIMEFGFIRPLLGEEHGIFYLIRALLLLDGFWPSADNYYSTVSWSISVEFVAYLLVALLLPLGRVGRTIGVCIAGLAVLAMVMRFNELGFGILLQRGMLGFFCGCLTYAIYRRLKRISDRSLANIYEACLVSIAIACICLAGGQWWSYLLCVPVFSLLILVFADEKGLISDWLRTGPMLAIGAWSYSIYMVHLFFISSLNRALGIAVNYMGRPDLGRTEGVLYGLRRVDFGALGNTVLSLAVLAMAIAAASFTYRFVEEPCRNWGKAYVRRRRNAADPIPQAASEGVIP